jgi:hypothetical protein
MCELGAPDSEYDRSEINLTVNVIGPTNFSTFFVVTEE